MNNLYGKWFYPSHNASGKRWWHALVEWWFSLTTSPLLSGSEFLEREIVLQSRLTSSTLFFTLLLVVVALPVPIIVHNWALLFALCGNILLHGVALLLNRQQRIVLAGILAVVAIDAGLMVAVISIGRVTAYSLSLCTLSVQSLCVAVSLLPPRSVFVVALSHCVFFFCVILVMPHSREVNFLLATQWYDMFLRLLTIQGIVAIMLFLWVRKNQWGTQRLFFADSILHAQHATVQEEQRIISEIVTQEQNTSRAADLLIDTITINGGLEHWNPTGTSVDQIAFWIMQQREKK